MDYKCRTDSPSFHIDHSHDWDGNTPDLPTSLELVQEMDAIDKAEFIQESFSPFELAQLFDALYESDAFQAAQFGDKLYQRFNDSRKGEYDNG